MTTEHHPISTGVIVTVVGGLILAGILGMIGKLPAIIGAMASAVSYAFGLLGTSIPVSMWLLGFGVSVAVISSKRRLSRWIDGRHELIEQTSTAESVEQVVQQTFESKEPELDEVQEAIMREYADADVRRLSIGNLCDAVPSSKLMVDQAVGRLQGHGFLDRAMTYRGELYILTAAGTDYIIEQGWAAN